MILRTLCLVVSTIFLTVILFRLRNTHLKKNLRVFAHLKNRSIAVDKGQFVKAGTLIGRVGNSVRASGILHLHMHVQNKATFDHGEKVTYPLRFRKMLRKRLLFWQEFSNGYLFRNDRFSD